MSEPLTHLELADELERAAYAADQADKLLVSTPERWKDLASRIRRLHALDLPAEDLVAVLEWFQLSTPEMQLKIVAAFVTRLAEAQKRIVELDLLVREGVGTHGELCEGKTCTFIARARAALQPPEPRDDH